MIARIVRDRRGAMGMLEMLIGLIVMGVLIAIAFHIYFKQGILDANNPSTQGVDVSTRQTAIDSAKKQVEELKKKINEQNKQLEILGH